MSTQDITILYKKLTELMDAGDEKNAKDFLIEHIKEFPADVQKKIVFEFFADALDKTVENKTRNTQIQKEGMEAIEEIEKEEKNLKGKQKMSNLRSDLGI